MEEVDTRKYTKFLSKSIRCFSLRIEFKTKIGEKYSMKKGEKMGRVGAQYGSK